VLLGYFGEHEHAACGNCDNCLKPARVWDGLVAAQKALSAVMRTGQRFGVAYLVDVLLGRVNERMEKFGHHTIKTFGIGTELDKRAWQAVFRQLVAQGHLAVDIEGHGGLRLGDSGAAVLRGDVPVSFREDEAEALRVKAKRDAVPRAARETAAPGDEALWQSLRALRLELARDQGVPPYVIFHDATLWAMVRDRPLDLDALAAIPGVGASKLRRYGDRFLAVLRA
jgi:ATP-dependent DNA helicase RecQ